MAFNKAQVLAEYYAENNWRTQPLTITYIEDADADTWADLPNTPDAWNDVRILWQPKEEKIIISCAATTEPGVSAVNNPMNSNGTFHILRDRLHQECWQIGRHITPRSNQWALVQCDTIVGTRDKNRDSSTVGDKIFDDAEGVNQHTTGNDADAQPPASVRGYSYGCLVGKWAKTHYNLFMPALRDSNQKKFDTVVISGDKFQEWRKSKGYAA